MCSDITYTGRGMYRVGGLVTRFLVCAGSEYIRKMQLVCDQTHEEEFTGTTVVKNMIRSMMTQ